MKIGKLMHKEDNMTDITDLAGPLVKRVHEALLDAGVWAFMPVVTEGEDWIAIMVADAGDIPHLGATIKKALARLRLKELTIDKKLVDGMTFYLVVFPIATNTITSTA